MIRILLAGRDETALSGLDAGLAKSAVQIIRADSGSNGMSIISETDFDLVVTDENLGDMTGLEFIRKIVSKRPMVNCAAVSSMASGDFHDASEGLGILMQLPVRPGKEHAESLLEHLKKILNTMKI
jgi:DNA-binding response OmpR family regulator